MSGGRVVKLITVAVPDAHSVGECEPIEATKAAKGRATITRLTGRIALLTRAH